MKNKKSVYSILGFGLALMVVMAVVDCASFGPQITQKQKFIRLHHMANTGAEANLKKNDAVAMACTKWRRERSSTPAEPVAAVRCFAAQRSLELLPPKA